jgi:hypothetical protein
MSDHRIGCLWRCRWPLPGQFKIFNVSTYIYAFLAISSLLGCVNRTAVTFSSEPSGARIYGPSIDLGGRIAYFGNTPITIPWTFADKKSVYNVKFQKKGYQTVLKNVRLQDNRIHAKLGLIKKPMKAYRAVEPTRQRTVGNDIGQEIKARCARKWGVDYSMQNTVATSNTKRRIGS